MTGSAGARRGRPWATARMTTLVAALAATALLTAACGGGSPSAAGSSGPGQGRLAQALAFAHCMRSHGAPNYPDPNSSGVFLVNPSNHARFDAPQSTRAACQHLLPRKGEPLTPAQQEQQQAQQLAFVACMHKDGFPQLPDGWSGNVGQLISAHIDPHSPRLNAAMNKCGSW
ncbi:MAG TPA: hypothetical protein VG123_13805 [Streptosporangiaceae bacterium]|nr:hypothetical protein [Streptosporangiaceae bacterium]